MTLVKKITGVTAAILGTAAVVTLFFTVDERYFHAEAAGKAFFQQTVDIQLRDTRRQIEIIDIRISLLANRSTLSPDEVEELLSLRVQRGILAKILADLEVK